MKKDNNTKSIGRTIDLENININNLRDFTQRLNSTEFEDVFSKNI